MKIIEIGTGYTPIPAQMGAATEIVVEELTRAFLKIGQDVEIIDIAAQKRAETDLPISEVKVPRIFTKTDVSLGIMHKLKRVFYSIALARYLKKRLKKEQEKVVLHFHNQYNLFFFLKLVSKKLRQKALIAYTNHSHVWHGEWDVIKDIVKKRYFQEIFCMKQANCVFVLNEKTISNIKKKVQIDPEKIFLIDNGVNASVYHILTEEEKIENKKLYGLSNKKVFIQIGSICERKNQLTSIRLLTPLLKQDCNLLYCYAGGIISDEYQECIQQYAIQNGIKDQVIYMGEIPPGKQLNKIYNLAEAMLFPSIAEGFSLTILEAMAAGVPVVIHQNLQFKLADKCLKYFDEENCLITIKENLLNKTKQE